MAKPQPTRIEPAPIDPLAAGAEDEYLDDLVRVRRHRRTGALPTGPDTLAVTAHFTLHRDGHRLGLDHRLPRNRIDNDLAVLLAGELFRPGWVCGSDLFERLLTGIVLSSTPDPLTSWELFYRNTLRQLALRHSRSGPVGGISDFAPIYRLAQQHAGTGSVLELGCCFGFLSLQLAGAGHQVTATDVAAGSVELLRQVAPLLGIALDTLSCDAARVPRPDASVDVVLAVHLLEHLEAEHGEAVLAEACRLAGRRVVVAVPFERVPEATFGHRRTFNRAGLHRLSRSVAPAGWQSEVRVEHGGWLILDRAS